MDETTVRVTLTSPYPGFLIQLASGFNAIVLPELADGFGLKEGPPVGTGPFVFDARGSHFLTRGIVTRDLVTGVSHNGSGVRESLAQKFAYRTLRVLQVGCQRHDSAPPSNHLLVDRCAAINHEVRPRNV